MYIANRRRRGARAALLVLLIAATALSACTVKLVSDYDTQTDQTAQAIYEILSRLSFDDADRDTQIEVLGAKINALEIRATSIAQNVSTVTAVKKLRENFEIMQQLTSAAAFELARDTMIQQAAQIIRLEIAKRRGTDK